MDTTLVTIIVSVACTVLGAVAVDLYVHFKNKTKKAIEKHKKEQSYRK